MKKSLAFLLYLIPYMISAQVQIGSDIDGAFTDDESGRSVSLSADGNVVAIGAPGGGQGGEGPGYVRVFENILGTWVQLGEQIDGEAPEDRFGWSVSLSADGNILAIGAPWNDGVNDGNSSSIGHVRVYQLNSGNWTQMGGDIDGEAESNESGVSIALSSDGSTVAIGAPANSETGKFSGHARIYDYTGENWTQIGEDIDGEAAWNECGASISLSADGEIVAIGAPSNSGNGELSGHVRVYKNEKGTWVQIGNDINGESSYNNSGTSVSLSADGSVLAIGATENDGIGGTGSDVGHVRVYQNSLGTWTQIGDDIDGEGLGDQSGWSVSLSDDGSTVAIGSRRNNGNGENSGHVRVFQNSGSNWTQLGTDIDGEFSFDQSGYSVSLSADGSVVAIGAFLNDENAFDSGHVRIFDLSTVSTDDGLTEDQVSVYPNPTNDIINFILNENIELLAVNIYSPLGKIIKTEFSSMISLAELAGGLYFVEIITSKGAITKTVIVR